MKDRLNTAVRLTIACACCRARLRAGRGRRPPGRCRRRPAEDVPGDRRAVLRRHERRGPHRGPDHDPLGLPRPDDDPGPQTRSPTPSRSRQRTASTSRSRSTRTGRARSRIRRGPPESSPPSPPSSRGRSRRSRTSSSATSRTRGASGSRSSTRIAPGQLVPPTSRFWLRLTTRSRPSTRTSRSSASVWARGEATIRSPRPTSRSPRCAASATWAAPIARASGGGQS